MLLSCRIRSTQLLRKILLKGSRTGECLFPAGTQIQCRIQTFLQGVIAKGGEFSFENLVFKELRNRGYLDKINKYEQGLKDKALSL